MEKDGTLRLDLVDVFGNRLREKVDVNPNGVVASSPGFPNPGFAATLIFKSTLKGLRCL